MAFSRERQHEREPQVHAGDVHDIGLVQIEKTRQLAAHPKLSDDVAQPGLGERGHGHRVGDLGPVALVCRLRQKQAHVALRGEPVGERDRVLAEIDRHERDA